MGFRWVISRLWKTPYLFWRGELDEMINSTNQLHLPKPEATAAHSQRQNADRLDGTAHCRFTYFRSPHVFLGPWLGLLPIVPVAGLKGLPARLWDWQERAVACLFSGALFGWLVVLRGFTSGRSKVVSVVLRRHERKEGLRFDVCWSVHFGNRHESAVTIFQPGLCKAVLNSIPDHLLLLH